ncbi:hypothetical protein [Nonomuraea basaltis]|uniref:hypothetical protein n=1 Tax=Nonomuraea basaltis TaxID=2495887 RepID=UPI00197EF634|nr:hypothetical protein [Nonomuraea basaltis]
MRVLLGVLIGVAGLIGTPADQPLLDRAVLPNRVRKLTSDQVLDALGSLGISAINQALGKAGRGITFPAPIMRGGPGWRAEVDLPLGVTVGEVLEKRDKLASGLRRALGCVWPEPVSEEQWAGPPRRRWTGEGRPATRRMRGRPPNRSLDL